MAVPLNSPRRRRAAVASAAAIPLALSFLVGASTAHASATSETLAGSQPAWADAAHDRGQVAGASAIDLRVYLTGRNPTGLDAYAAAVSNPNSAQYHRYMTPAQVQSAFGATKGQVDAIKAWLASSGLTVTGTTPEYVAVHGTAAAVQKAFGASLHEYATASGGLLRAPSSDLKVPASVAGTILSVTGVTQTNRVNQPASRQTNADVTYVSPSKKTPPPPYIGALPCSAYQGQQVATSLPSAYGSSVPWAVCGYVPSQVRGAYGVDKTDLTGKGVTIAIVDAYGLSSMQADANTYATLHGDKAFKPGQYSEVFNPATWTEQDICGPSGWAGEEALDVEAVHGMAPAAKVVYVGANSCFDTSGGGFAPNGGLLDALTMVVDQHLADMVSDSWGEVMHGFDANGNPADMDPALIAAYEQTFKKGAVEGIGFYFSSGDCGAEDPTTSSCAVNDGSSRAQTDYPTSDPWVTSVGGTSIAIGKNNKYEYETGWQTATTGLTADRSAWASPPGTYIYGAGGGTNEDFAQPFYQAFTVPPSLADHLLNGAWTSPRRVVPDVSANADPNTGFLSGYTRPLPDGTIGYGEGRIGGTSLACPTFVGIQADLQQKLDFSIGFANPGIYLANAFTPLFRDVTDTPLGPNTTIAIVRNGVTNPALRTFAQGTLQHATVGYDNTTGVGSPNLAFLKK